MKLGGKFWWLTSAVISGTILIPGLLVAADDVPTPSVIISELAWAGSSRQDGSTDSTDEWLELKNTTAEPMAIGGWRLTRLVSGEERTLTTLPANATIAADGYFIIARQTAATSVLTIEPDWLDDVDFRLVNSNLLIRLYNAEEQLIDTADDGTGAPLAGRSTTPKASMERNTDIGPGDQPTSWHTALSTTNLDSDTSDMGTPGAMNSMIIEPPTLTSITPTSAVTDTLLEIESIVGTNFSTDPPPTVQLKLGSVVVTADNILAASPELIDHGQFSLEGAETGEWDLVVINPDGQMALLPQAVEITEPLPQYDLSTTIRLNEIYPQPNTTSNDEFIELYNFGENAIGLTGWVVDDVRNGGSNPYTLPATSIPPKGYVLLYKPDTKLTLNDGGDDVYLIQPNGFELDHTTYQTAPRGQTWARFDDGWKWTNSPTPNGNNVLSVPPADTEPDIVDEPDDAPVTPPSFQAGDLLITELLPNPGEDEEFIELFNSSSQPIELVDWTLQDRAKHKYKIRDFAVNIQATNSLTIQPQQYIVITETMSGIALNNTGGETVTLLDPAGNVIASVSYVDKAPIGAVYALSNGVWTWSEYPTPGTVNVLGLDEADETPPAVDVVLPQTLPVTGESTRRRVGSGLAGLALGVIVAWNYAHRRYKKFG